MPAAVTGFILTLLLTWVPLHSSHLPILTCLSSQRTAIAYYHFFLSYSVDFFFYKRALGIFMLNKSCQLDVQVWMVTNNIGLGNAV